MEKEVGYEEALSAAKQLENFLRPLAKVPELVRFIGAVKQKQKEAEDNTRKAKKELESIHINIERSQKVLSDTIQEQKNRVPLAINEANKQIDSALSGGRAEVLALKKEADDGQKKMSEMIFPVLPCYSNLYGWLYTQG